jgi:hypothetical protein
MSELALPVTMSADRRSLCRDAQPAFLMMTADSRSLSDQSQCLGSTWKMAQWTAMLSGLLGLCSLQSHTKRGEPRSGSHRRTVGCSSGPVGKCAILLVLVRFF